MRLVLAAAACLGFISLSGAAEVAAAVRQHTSIPAQDLGSALQALAASREMHIMFVSDDVRNRRAAAISGELTPAEALQLLLDGTGLTYRFLDEKTISIFPVGAEGLGQAPAAAARFGETGDAGGDGSSRRASAAGAGGAWERMRLVQADANKPTDDESGRNASGDGTTDGAVQEVVVTAQKRTERLQDVPISISVLRGEELDRSSLNVSDALNRVPGVATQQNYLGGGTMVVVRGVAPSGPFASGSSAVAYYLDSIPFGLVRSALGPDSNAYDMERIEVLRGPQGTLYGASALNGVVRILTHDADLSRFDFKARLADSATEGGGNNYRGDVAINVPLVEDKLAVRAVVGYENADGWVDYPNAQNVNSREIQTYRLKVNGQPTQDLSIGLSAWSSRDHADAPSVGYDFDRGASVLRQPVATDYDTFGLKVGYRFPGVAASSATSYLDYSNDGFLGLDVPYFSAPDTLFFSGIKSEVFSQEFNLSSTGEGAWRWSAGGIYRRATEDITQYFTGAYDFIPLSLILCTSKSYAVYGELTRLFMQGRLELTAGVRHFEDDVEGRYRPAPTAPFAVEEFSAEANTPRAVLTWHVSDRQTVYASYAQGFRSGFPQFGLPAGFPTLHPDRLRNYEVGSKGSALGGKIAFDASLYYMDWQGIQSQLTVPYFGVPYLAIVNGEGASGVGTDLAVSVNPTDRLTLQASVSWNSLEMDSNVISAGQVLFTKGDRPASSPKNTAGVSAEYKFGIGSSGYEATLLGSVNYTSEQTYRGILGPDVLIQTGDPMTMARASFAVASPQRWVATLYADNINNERGAPVRTFIGVDNWEARVRPRTIGLQLEYHFAK